MSIITVAGFAMPEKSRITVTGSNEKNWDGIHFIYHVL